MNKLFRHVLRNILAGMPVLLPIIATIFIFVKIFDFTDSVLPSLFHSIAPIMPPQWFPGIGFLIIAISMYVTGILTKIYLGKMIIHLGNRLIVKIPLVNKVYIAVQQILDAVFSNKKKAFEKVVLAEYPRKGCYSIGFLTSSRATSISTRAGQDFVTVFIPTAPTPTQGFIAILPRHEIVVLDIPVDIALKYIMSAGIINPDKLAKRMHLYEVPTTPENWNWLDNLKKRKQDIYADPRD